MPTIIFSTQIFSWYIVSIRSGLDMDAIIFYFVNNFIRYFM